MLLLIAIAYAPSYIDLSAASVGWHPAGGTVVDGAARVFTLLFVDNRAFPMFAALFGYGLIMLVDGQQAKGTSENEARRLLRRRSFFLLAFGFVHAALVFPGEILGTYGLAGLLIGWLLFRPDRVILRAAAVLTPFYVLTVMGLAFTSQQTELTPIAGYTTAADWAERVVFWPFTPVYVAIAYPLFVALLLGAWAGRRRLLHDPAEHRTLLRRVAVIGIGVSLLGALPAVLVEVGLLGNPDTSGPLMGLQTLTGVFGGLGYAAVFGLIAASRGERRGPVTRALAATGQRSLTSYLLLSVLLAVFMHRDLIGLGEHVHSAGALGIAFGCWLVAVLFAVALDKAGRKGPADAFIRSLVYRNRR
ncbi:hypothetical protein DSY14_16235 [Nocardiopsis sp. MG754419]|nr:hypothetical protein [Nocardiopsis sp. MG754419]